MGRACVRSASSKLLVPAEKPSHVQSETNEQRMFKGDKKWHRFEDSVTIATVNGQRNKGTTGPVSIRLSALISRFNGHDEFFCRLGLSGRRRPIISQLGFPIIRHFPGSPSLVPRLLGISTFRPSRLFEILPFRNYSEFPHSTSFVLQLFRIFAPPVPRFAFSTFRSGNEIYDRNAGTLVEKVD